MDFLSLLLLFYFSYRNSVRAKLKHQKGFVWGLITGVVMFLAEMIGVAFVVFYFCRDIINLGALADPKYKDAAVQQLTQAFANNPLHRLTVVLFGFGGYLIIRYVLDRMPDKKQPEVHWMDRMEKHEQ
jgi:hypothetical protein